MLGRDSNGTTISCHRFPHPFPPVSPIHLTLTPYPLPTSLHSTPHRHTRPHRENREQRGDIKSLREQLFRLKMELQVSRSSLGVGPVPRPLGEGPARGESRAMALLKQLKGQVPRFTRAEEIIDRLVAEINYIAR